MKLQRLYLENYQVLRKLEIYFSPHTENVLIRNPSYSLDFLVGVNGTGKSTVLRALFNLLKEIEAHNTVDYGFELDYELGKGTNKRKIRLSNFPQKTESEEFNSEQNLPLGELNIWENDEKIEFSDSILPYIVAFTTGSENAWKNLYDKPTIDNGDVEALQGLSLFDRAIRETPGNPPNLEPLEDFQTDNVSKLLFIESNHISLSLVTLCGLIADLAQDENDRRLTEVLRGTKEGKDKGANIRAIAGFSLKFRITQATTTQTDQDKIKQLAELATRSSNRNLRLGSDHLLVFDLTTSANSTAQSIIEKFSNGLELFKVLARLAKVGDNGQSVLREVNIFIERLCSDDSGNEEQEDPPLLLFNQLSDGERSFLGRMCLFTLLGETEALILLDEPEVHFNDFWKRQIVSLLDKTLEGRQSHILITTHSSITLSDVLEDDIVILERLSSYTSKATNPSVKTFAADPSDIMVHVFHASHPTGQKSVSSIKRILSEETNESLEERRQTLESLLEIVAQGYWSYKIRRELLALEPE